MPPEEREQGGLNMLLARLAHNYLYALARTLPA